MNEIEPNATLYSPDNQKRLRKVTSKMDADAETVHELTQNRAITP